MTETLGTNGADIAAIIVVLIGMIIGYRQGLSGLVIFMLTGAAIWVLQDKFYNPCRIWLESLSVAPDNAAIVTRIILFVIPILAGVFVYLLLSKFLESTIVAIVDHIGGALTGGLAATCIVLVAFIVINQLPGEMKPECVGKSSWIGRLVIEKKSPVIQQLVAHVERGESTIMNVCKPCPVTKN